MVLVGLCGVLAGILWYAQRHPGAVSIPPFGGDKALTLRLMDSPIYLQTDKRWRNERIGGSRERIGAVGCTICCVAMTLTYQGVPVDPLMLNTHLKRHNGYTPRGWVIWKAVAALSEGIRIDIPKTPTHRKIDKTLKGGTPVLAKVLLYDRIPHWVLIVGKRDGQYYMLDPLGDGKTVDELSQLNSNIYAIRIITTSQAR
jgi:hypothetical protein